MSKYKGYKDYIENRVLEVARYMVITNESIRDIAKKFGVSKSTIHKDLSIRLKDINLALYREVQKILPENKEYGPIKGGYVTQARWQDVKSSRVS